MSPKVKIILTSLIPTFLIFIGRSDGFCNFFKINFSIEEKIIATSQMICFIVGLIWAGLVIPIQYSNLKDEFEAKNEILKELIIFNRRGLFEAFKSSLTHIDIDKLNTRIFVPKKYPWYCFWKWFSKEKEFETFEYDGITTAMNNGKPLVFQVNPKAEGLVGRSYETKGMIIDCNVKANIDSYNLTPYQKLQTSDVNFCTTIPIFNDKKQKDVVAIVSIDSTQQITLNAAEQRVWSDNIIYYSAFIEKNLNF